MSSFASVLIVMGELVTPPPTAEILGGEPTVDGEWDAVVGYFADGVACTGSVIAPRLVLTAGHCVYGLDPAVEQLQINYGSTMTQERTVAVEDFATHPEFCEHVGCGHERYDYAYLWLEQPVTINTGYLEVLTEQHEWDYAMGIDFPVTVVGYGGTETSLVPGRKHRVTLSITGSSESGLEFDAGGDGRDSCTGDSGGPAVVRLADGSWRLAGVLSRGSDPCGDGGTYGVAAEALPWIRDATGVDLLPAGCDGDCLDLTLRGADASLCRVAPADGPRSLWWLLLLAWIAPRPARIAEG